MLACTVYQHISIAEGIVNYKLRFLIFDIPVLICKVQSYEKYYFCILFNLIYLLASKECMIFFLISTVTCVCVVAACPTGLVSETGLFPCFPCPRDHFQHQQGASHCYRSMSDTNHVKQRAGLIQYYFIFCTGRVFAYELHSLEFLH